jgi:hypothetical protein
LDDEFGDGYLLDGHNAQLKKITINSHALAQVVAIF